MPLPVASGCEFSTPGRATPYRKETIQFTHESYSLRHCIAESCRVICAVGDEVCGMTSPLAPVLKSFTRRTDREKLFRRYGDKSRCCRGIAALLMATQNVVAYPHGQYSAPLWSFSGICLRLRNRSFCLHPLLTNLTPGVFTSARGL